MHGPFVIETAIDTWSGHFQGVLEDGLSSGTFTEQGVGRTMQRGTFVVVAPGLIEAEGVILHRP